MKDPHGNRSLKHSQHQAAHLCISCIGALGIFLLILCGSANAEQPVEVRVDLEEREVYLGESFIYRIQVLGGSHVGTPDVSRFEDFEVREFPKAWLRYRGTDWLDPNTLDLGTSYFFRLVALRTGLITLPSATIDVDGRIYSTPAFHIRVELPPPSYEFKFSLSLSKNRVYVGEPIVLTAVWYYLKEARYFYAIIPILKHPDFYTLGAQDNGSSVRIFVRSSVGSHYLQGEGGTEVINGVSYSTATFKQVIIPDSTGEFDFLPGTVQAWTPIEDSASRTPDSGSNWNYKSTVVASNRISLRVLPLPIQGKPANFTGIIAEEVHITSSVTHTEMNVGDPITLSVEMWGPPSLEKAQIPPLSSIAELTSGFKIRSDPMDVQLEKDRKLFSQTIRVKSESVRRIPTIEVPYFNTRSGSYEVARSKPIPITVRPTRLLTASDLEGGNIPGISRTSVRDWEEGIRFNYTGTTLLLTEQSYGIRSLMRSPVALILLLIPFSIFGGALLYTVRRRYSERISESGDTTVTQKSTPFRRLLEQLEEIKREDDAGTGEALVAWRDYLGMKLGLRPGRLTLGEMEKELFLRGLEEDLILEIGELFRHYELYRYRHRSDSIPESDPSILSRIARVASELERRLSSYE
jgi:hypothetical protein